MFEIGTIYRRRDLHHEIGGQRQGGISTPRDFAGVLLFTGASGEKYGYSDGWSAGVFRYTGEGQRGDMAFVRGNRAVRDHGENGRDLYLFAIETSGCRYLGPFACGGWSRERAPDGTGALRSAIVFDLIPLTPGLPDVSTGPASNTPISELRRRALAASAAVAESQDSTRVQTFRSRSRDVADYVLARAAGRLRGVQARSSIRAVRRVAVSRNAPHPPSRRRRPRAPTLGGRSLPELPSESPLRRGPGRVQPQPGNADSGAGAGLKGARGCTRFGDSEGCGPSDFTYRPG